MRVTPAAGQRDAVPQAAELKLWFKGDGTRQPPKGAPAMGELAGLLRPKRRAAGVAQGARTCRVQDGDCHCSQGMWQPLEAG